MNLAKVVGVVVLLLTWSAPSLADDVFSRSYGVFYVVLPDSGGISRGEFVDCDTSSEEGLLLVVESVFAQYEGVCDDRGDLPCDGKLLSRIEGCLNENPTTYTAGGISVRYTSDIPMIMCYDPTGNGSCTTVDQVATGTSGQFTGTVPGSDFSFGNNIQTFNRGDRFVFEGERVRIRKASFLTLSTIEAATPGSSDNCALRDPETGDGGCGFSAISTRLD